MTIAEPKGAGSPEDVLTLAEKWARDLGNVTARISGTTPDGHEIPALSIKHGVFTVFCREEAGALHFSAILDIPADARSQLRKLDAPSQTRLLTTLKVALMENPRTGFGFFPVEFQRVYEIQKISLDQVVKISPDDSSTFNRFSDAIQELSTGLLKTVMVFSPVQLLQATPRDDTMYR